MIDHGLASNPWHVSGYPTVSALRGCMKFSCSDVDSGPIARYGFCTLAYVANVFDR